MLRAGPSMEATMAMTADEYRQHCHDIIRTHRPARTWRALWRLRCTACGWPWQRGDEDGCWPVRGALVELGAMPLPARRSMRHEPIVR